MSPDLPAEVRTALDRLTEGVSRADLARRAAAISESYRTGAGSETISSRDDALAYAITRMPATYAAAATALDVLMTVLPDFAPTSLIDVGAGPGTATFAAAQGFPSLRQITLFDHNPHLQSLARTLLAASLGPALAAARYDRPGPVGNLSELNSADLVIASYVIGEIVPDRAPEFADDLWARASSVLIVVEPGTPIGYGRIAALRTQLIGRGAHVIAPCPHEHPCPIVAPDWCHFARRLPRTRDHRRVKDVTLPYEDEKFSYVILARAATHRHFDARVLAPPQVGKVAATAKLCTREGTIVADTATRRDRDAYRVRKQWRWGDAVCRPQPQPVDA